MICYDRILKICRNSMSTNSPEFRNTYRASLLYSVYVGLCTGIDSRLGLTFLYWLLLGYHLRSS